MNDNFKLYGLVGSEIKNEYYMFRKSTKMTSIAKDH